MIFNGFINDKPRWISESGNYIIYWTTQSGGYWTVQQLDTTISFSYPWTFINPTVPPIGLWSVQGASPTARVLTYQGNCVINTDIGGGSGGGTGTGNTGGTGGTTNDPTQNPALKSSTSYNGSILLKATSGTKPFQYSIDGGLTYRSIPLFTKLAPGTYTTVIKDVSGRTTYNTVILSEPPKATIYQVTLQTQSVKQRNNSILYTSTIKTSPELPSGVTVTFDLIHTNTFRSSTTTTAATMTNSSLMKRNGRNFTANTVNTVTSTTLNTLAGCQSNTIYISGKTETWSSVSYSTSTTLSFETTTLVTKNLVDKCYVGEAIDKFVITNLSISGCSSCGVVNSSV